MEEFFTNAMNSGNATAIIAAAVVYIVVHIQRNSTGKKRDNENTLMNYRIDQLEKNHGSLMSTIKELQGSIVDLELAITKLTEKVK